MGITTLEEVFLKIGHGEEEEQARFEKEAFRITDEKNKINGGDSLTSDANVLDNYTLDDAAKGRASQV